MVCALPRPLPLLLPLLAALAVCLGAAGPAQAWKTLPSHDWFAARCPYIDENAAPSDSLTWGKRNIAIHCMVNQVRQYNGISGLAANSTLNNYAVYKLQLAQQCGTGSNAHYPCGYTGWPSGFGYLAENWGGGQSYKGTPWALFAGNGSQSWWYSLGHQTNLMNYRYRYQGIATGWAYITSLGAWGYIAYHEFGG